MKKTTPNVDPVDTYVGARVRGLRILRNMTQSDLAKHLDLSFQQLQKYETGANRVSASKLHAIAKVLGVSPCYFFEGLDDDANDSDAIELDLETARFAALISRISNKETKDSLRILIKSIVPQETQSPEGHA